MYHRRGARRHPGARRTVGKKGCPVAGDSTGGAIYGEERTAGKKGCPVAGDSTGGAVYGRGKDGGEEERTMGWERRGRGQGKPDKKVCKGGKKAVTLGCDMCDMCSI